MSVPESETSRSPVPLDVLVASVELVKPVTDNARASHHAQAPSKSMDRVEHLENVPKSDDDYDSAPLAVYQHDWRLVSEHVKDDA